MYLLEEEMFQFRFDRLKAMAVQVGKNAEPVLTLQMTEAVYGTSLGQPLNLALNLTLIALAVGLLWKRPLWGMFVLATIAMILIVPKPQERYFLPILPILVFAWWRVLLRINRYSRLPHSGECRVCRAAGTSHIANGAGLSASHWNSESQSSCCTTKTAATRRPTKWGP